MFHKLKEMMHEQMRISRNRIHFLKTAEICQVEEYNKSHKIFAQRLVICYYSEEQKEKKNLKSEENTRDLQDINKGIYIHIMGKEREKAYLKK